MATSTRNTATTFGLVFLASMSLYTLTAGGSLTSTDAVVTYELARSLVERGSIALEGDVIGSETNRGLDGRYYSQFGLGQSLYDVPFYLAGRAAVRLAGRPIGKPDTIPKAAVAFGSAVAAAVAVALVWLLALQITHHPRAGLVAAAGAAIASPLWPYSKFGFSTALTTATLAGAACLVWSATRSGRHSTAAWAGALLAFGWLTRHEMAVMLLPFAAVPIVDRQQREGSNGLTIAATIALVTCVGGVLWMLYNAARFGQPFFVGYTPAFGTEGYAAFLVSPTGSVLLFCPIAMPWIAGILALRHRPSAMLLLAAPFVVSYLFYGALVDWPGGRSYGPRYLVPALVMLSPGLAVLVARRRLRLGTAALLAAILAVLQLPGVLVDYSKVSVEWATSVPRQELASRAWRLSASPLLLGAAAAVRTVPANAAFLAGTRPLPATPAAAGGDRTFAQQLSFSLDFWWAYLVYLRVLPAPLAVTVACILFSVTLGCAWLAWRSAGTVVPHVIEET